jgi:site-specific DNA-methyltransferase (adenine-specific)
METILTKSMTANTLYQEYSASTNVDQILQRRKRDEQGKSVYDIDENGKVLPNGGKKGVPFSDVWDLPYLNPKAKERVGYPTQKPVLLLERIIKIASNEGDWVLDPFCGSGTTLVAAALLNRNAIGIDSSQDAIELTRSRLESLVKTESNLLEKGRDAYKGTNEEALSLLQGLDYAPVHSNEGIDAILRDDIDGCPIPIRVQRRHETIFEAATCLYRAGRTKNAAVMVLVTVRKGGYLQIGEELPPGVVVVESPAVLISELVQREVAGFP